MRIWHDADNGSDTLLVPQRISRFTHIP